MIILFQISYIWRYILCSILKLFFSTPNETFREIFRKLNGEYALSQSASMVVVLQLVKLMYMEGRGGVSMLIMSLKSTPDDTSSLSYHHHKWYYPTSPKAGTCYRLSPPLPRWCMLQSWPPVHQRLLLTSSSSTVGSTDGAAVVVAIAELLGLLSSCQNVLWYGHKNMFIMMLK